MNAQLLQLVISVGGIAAMVGLCQVLFGAAEGSLGDITAVAETIARDVPGFRAGQAALSRDARAALIENVRDGQVYLAVARGSDLVTRRLGSGVRVARKGNSLELGFDDYTLREAKLELPDAATWELKLKGLAA